MVLGFRGLCFEKGMWKGYVVGTGDGLDVERDGWWICGRKFCFYTPIRFRSGGLKLRIEVGLKDMIRP